MKKICLILGIIMVLAVLSACSGQSLETTGTEHTVQASEETLFTGVLYADFSCGSPDDNTIREYPFEYSGVPKTAEELADELSALTGLDFVITAGETADGSLTGLRILRLSLDWMTVSRRMPFSSMILIPCVGL